MVNSRLACWSIDEDQPTTPFDQAVLDAFLARAGMELDQAREGRLAATLCNDGSVAATLATNGMPTIGEAREACEAPTIPGVIGKDPGDSGGLFPGAFGAASGMPSASSISCSAQGGANPYAQEAPKQPAVSDGDIAASLYSSWLTGTAVAVGTAKGMGGAATLVGSGLAAGAGSAGLVAWGQSVADKLGHLMEARYRDAAAGLAVDAAGWAVVAEGFAVAAELWADDSDSPEAQAAADQARAAADEAKKAAEAAKQAAKQAAEAKSRAEVAAAHEAAKKADAEAKKKAEEAKKAQQEAKKKAEESKKGAGATGGSSTTPVAGAPGSTCEQVRRQVWECEAGGWKSFSCQELARMLQGCRVDMSVALVDDQSAVCGVSTITTEDLVRARDEACGLQVAQPMPGVDPCSLTVEGSPEIRGDCDPTIAHDGCPNEPVVIEDRDDTVCFSAPPSAPPMPCLDPTPGGGPRIGGFLQDKFGFVYVVGTGGIVALGLGYPPRV